MSLDAERVRWQQVKGILGKLLELPPADRAAALPDLCRDDLGLHDEVSNLLALHGTETMSIEHAPFISNLVQQRGAALSAGASIGAWTLERELGEGGMGSVWLARRSNATFHQFAAIKVIRGIASATLLARLRSERQALAALNHRNIAHLIDGGETPDGAPYIVMEYIDGQPIDEWCRSRRLDARACLQLMMQLVDAVAHAHEHLLVHRDIKPSNVLVTAEGQVKLLDFGVSKLLAPEGDSLAATEFGDRALTPEYASPEQVQGGSITVATDVYGLGATLYRMLTGSSPFGGVERDAYALLKAVVEEAPTRVSLTMRQNDTRAANVPRENWHALIGDVDTILAKALAKDPADRYGTVDALGRDIQAHLNGYPIAAQPPTWRYVAWKFIRRHRLASAATATAALSLVVGLITALHQANVANIQRDLARSEQERATAALKIAEQERTRATRALVNEQLERNAAVAATAQAELQRGAAQASAVAATSAQRNAEAQRLLAASRFSDVRALANRVVSEYADDLLGTFGTSETRLKIVDDSVRFLDRLRVDASRDPGLLSELSRGYRKLAFALSGDASLRDYPRAEQQLALARQLREEVMKARGRTPSDIAEMALIDEASGDLARQQYRFAVARTMLDRARSAFAELKGWKFADPWDRVGPARASLHAADALVEPGTTQANSGTAMNLLEEAQDALEAILSNTPKDAVARFHLSAVHMARAMLLRQTGNFESANVQFDHAERLAGDLVNQFPNNAIYVQQWSRVLGDRKTLRISMGREEAGFADGIKRAELASVVRAREPANPLAVLNDLVAWSALCSDYLRLDKDVALARVPCQHAVEGARAMLAMRQVDPFAAPAYQALMVAGLANVQSALRVGGDQAAIDAALAMQATGLAGLTRLTPPVSEDPLRTAYLVNTRIALAHGLELAGQHEEATRVHMENLSLIAAIRQAKIDEIATPSLTMFTRRRMAHNFLAHALRGEVKDSEAARLRDQSIDSAKKYIATANEAEARGRLSALFASYVPEMNAMIRAHEAKDTVPPPPPSERKELR